MAALLDFGKHKGKELGSVPTSYLKWIVKELPQPHLVGWKVLAQEVLKQRLKNPDSSSAVDKLVDNLDDVPTLEVSKTIVPFGKHRGKELGKLSTSYLKWMATELTDGNRALWGLVARSILDQRAADASRTPAATTDSQLLAILEARRTSIHDISEEFGLDESTAPLDSTAYAELLRQCIKNRNIEKGRLLHARIVEQGYSKNTFLANLVVQMYGSCGAVAEAKAAFDEIARPNSFSWNVLLAAYAQNGFVEEASRIYENLDEKDVVAGTMMLTAYARAGDLLRARRIFDSMEEKNVVSWTAMIAGYGRNGELEEARRLFDQLRKPNQVAWNTIIAAYAQNGDVEGAREMLDKMPDQTISAWNILVSGYAQQGKLEEARQVFDEMPKRDFISWNMMITAYAQSGELKEATRLFNSTRMQNVGSFNAMIGAFVAANEPSEAMRYFWRMNFQGLHADSNSIASVVRACSTIEQAKTVVETFWPITGEVVKAAMVCICGRLGHLEAARSTFQADDTDRKASAAWNAIMASNAWNGQVQEALDMFYSMNQEGSSPCVVSITAALCLCKELGLHEQGVQLVSSVIGGDFDDVEPAVEHYICAVGILGRLGKVEQAEELVHSMPFKPTLAAWIELLEASKLHKNTAVAKRAAAEAIKLEPSSNAPYELLAAVYSAAGDTAVAKRVKKKMKERFRVRV